MTSLSTVRNYSQNAEQTFILDACGPTGRFLDIGAWNAFDKSNTRALFERGWGGLLIEPSPAPFVGLDKEYDDAPNVYVLCAAVIFDGSLKEVSMHVTADAVSTTDTAHYERWKDHAHFDGYLRVPAITLERIYEDYGEFDFVNIDTEGTSADLLRRLFVIGKRPQVICVEHDQRTTEILSDATVRGYSCVYVSGENLVLVRT